VTDAAYAADNSMGSTIEGSSFSGLLTRVEVDHIRIGSAGNGRRLRGVSLACARGLGFDSLNANKVSLARSNRDDDF
jgi:hypothetical protein